MFRRTEGILGDSGNDTANGNDLAALDADLIVTTVVLGFVAGRLSVGHPIEFRAEDGPDRTRLDQTTKLINKVLGAEFSFGGEVTTGRTPDWKEGAMITGAAGAAATLFAQRHAQIVGEAAKQLHAIASTDKNVGYQGPGCVHGFRRRPLRPAGRHHGDRTLQRSRVHRW